MASKGPFGIVIDWTDYIDALNAHIPQHPLVDALDLQARNPFVPEDWRRFYRQCADAIYHNQDNYILRLEHHEYRDMVYGVMDPYSMFIKGL